MIYLVGYILRIRLHEISYHMNTQPRKSVKPPSRQETPPATRRVPCVRHSVSKLPGPPTPHPAHVVYVVPPPPPTAHPAHVCSFYYIEEFQVLCASFCLNFLAAQLTHRTLFIYEWDLAPPQALHYPAKKHTRCSSHTAHVSGFHHAQEFSHYTYVKALYVHLFIASMLVVVMSVRVDASMVLLPPIHVLNYFIVVAHPPGEVGEKASKSYSPCYLLW